MDTASLLPSVFHFHICDSRSVALKMESVQLLAEPSDMLGGHVLSLASGDVLRADSSIIFSQDALSSGIIATGKRTSNTMLFVEENSLYHLILFPCFFCFRWK